MIFILDTNVLWKRKKIAQLAVIAKKHAHHLQVPALVHAERLAQVRRDLQKDGKTFDQRVIDALLDTHGIEVVPFDRTVAERSALVLAGMFPSPDHWHEARRERCAHRFQVAQTNTPGPVCPATIDWYLHASYATVPATFVTLDGGLDFEGMQVVDLDRAIALAAGSA